MLWCKVRDSQLCEWPFTCRGDVLQEALRVFLQPHRLLRVSWKGRADEFCFYCLFQIVFCFHREFYIFPYVFTTFKRMWWMSLFFAKKSYSCLFPNDFYPSPWSQLILIVGWTCISNTVCLLNVLYPCFKDEANFACDIWNLLLYRKVL